jgi:hypothetical protein
MSGGFFGGFPWGGGGGNSGQQSGRGSNHPNRHTQGPGGGLRCISLRDERDYDLANDGRDFQGEQYSQRCSLSKAEYKAWRQAVFQRLGPRGPVQEQQQTGEGTRGGITTPQTQSVTWLGQHATGLPPAANINQGPPGQQGLPGPPGSGGLTSAALAPQAQQGGAQIGGQPPGGHGGPVTGTAQATAGKGGNVPTPQEYLGISLALNRMSQIMTDADTTRNLCWQKDVSGGVNKLAAWRVEATSNPVLQFYPYMQPGEAFMVVGHSMSTIYSTTMDLTSLHRKVVLFTGDCKGGRECIPVILPPQAAFAWTTCKAINDKSKLMAWYPDNPTEYGNLWDPTAGDETKEDILIPQLIALPLRAAKLYHQLGGAVMPHELLDSLETHLASLETSLDDRDDWGLVQKMAACGSTQRWRQWGPEQVEISYRGPG